MIDATDLARVIDAVIAFTAIEGVLLALLHRATGRGVAPREYAANLVSGLCLMLALRAFAHDAGAAWVMAALLGAGLAHGTDLWRRWQRTPRGAHPTAPAIARLQP